MKGIEMYVLLLSALLTSPGETQAPKVITGVPAPTAAQTSCTGQKTRSRLFRSNCTGAKQASCTGAKHASCAGKVTIVKTKTRTRSCSCAGASVETTKPPEPAKKTLSSTPVTIESSTTKTIGDRIYRRSVYFEPDPATNR